MYNCSYCVNYCFYLFRRMLPEIVGNLYVGGYEKPFAVINVKVLYCSYSGKFLKG